MKKLLLVALTLVLLAIPVYSQSPITGWCQQGNNTVSTIGLISTTKVQRSFPSCTVTVLDSGTVNLSTIFSDAGGTPLANPFTAASSGFYSFYVNNGSFDIRLSSGGIITPFVERTVKISDAASGIGGSGTANRVAKFTAGATIANSQITDNGVSVGINNTSPAASSLLDLTSTTLGLLPPRMTTGQRDAISSPATGLTIFNTTTGQLNIFSGSWGAVAGSGLSDPGGNGYIVRTALNTTINRTLTGTANQIAVANGDGTAGNSIFSLPSDVTIATSLTVPTLFGGTAATADLTIRASSNGTPTTADVIIDLPTSGRFLLGPATQRWVFNPYETDILIGQAPILYTPTFSRTSGADFRNVGIMSRPIFGTTTGAEALAWTAYNGQYGFPTTITAGTKGFLSIYEGSIDTSQAAADITAGEAGHIFGGTMFTRGGAPMSGINLALTIATVAPVTGSGVRGLNMSLTNNIAGGLIYGVGVQQAGANTGTAGFILTGTWTTGIDVSTATIGTDAIRLANGQAIMSGGTKILYRDVTSTFVTFDTNVALNVTNPFVQLGSAATGWLYQLVDADQRLRFFKQGLGEAFFADIGLNIVIGGNPGAALATSAQNGFFHIPTMAGSPTLVPATYTGRVPIVYDTTGDNLRLYNAAWKTLNAVEPARITDGSGTGLTVVESGRFERVVHKVTVTFAALSAAAATADKTIAVLPAKTRLVGIIADTTIPYSGGAVSAASIIVGKTVGGNEYLLTHSVFGATIVRGLADGDLGASLARATAIQGGDLPSWTATTNVSVRITTTGANTNALTAGSTTYYLITEKHP